MLKKILVSIFLVSSLLIKSCFAATPVTITVDTDNAGSPDYTVLNTALATEADDITDGSGTDEVFTFNCSGTAADTTGVDVIGWTTDPDNDITINGNNTSGQYSTSYYRLEVAPGSNGETVLEINEEYVTVNDVQTKIDDSSNSGNCIEINCNNATSSILIDSCIMEMPGNQAATYPIRSTSDCVAIIKNCLAYETGSGTSHGYLVSAGTVTFYNCTYYSGVDGFERDAGTVVCTNCVAIDISDDGFEGTMTKTTNISDAPNGQPSIVTTQTDAQLFTDPTATAWDFSIKDTNSDLDSTQNTYTNLSASGVTVDIEDTTRVTWDGGCFTLEAAVSGPKKGAVIIVN
jgi:hypothetical protein